MNISAVIFDMDGVLVDTEPYYLENNQRLFRELGFSISTEEYLRFVGIDARRMWIDLKERFHLSLSVDELIDLEYDRYLRRLASLSTLPPLPGIHPLIERLNSLRRPLAVASSSPRRVVELTLAKAGLIGFFPVRVCGDEIERGKPHPDIFLKAAQRLGVPPSQCLVIEDSPRGIAGARAAGMKTIGFRNPHSGHHDLSAADHVVEEFSDETIDLIIRMTNATSPTA